MQNFWDFSVWGLVNLVAVLLISLFAANMLKKAISFLKKSLIPTSVLGGTVLLIISAAYRLITGQVMFDTAFFGGNGSEVLEVITYHALALGFIATTFKPSKGRFTKQRSVEIFNTGVTTVATYLMQGVLGLGITLLATFIMKDMFAAAGVLLPFGYGQGTGQALNYGGIYETDWGFVGGKSFGLTIAALGFISASFGGVIHLNIIKKQGRIKLADNEASPNLITSDVQGDDEIPMNGSMDKLSVQMAFIFAAYIISYVIIYFLGNLLPGLKSVLYGFNFLIGVLVATLLCAFVGMLRQKGIVRRQHINTFLMKRISGFFFDLMVIAGIAAIRIDTLKRYWAVMLILGFAGALSTYFYNRFVARKLFKDYEEQQFLAMYGMLTGTASTGVILMREIDPEYETPASDNLVYQNLPAMVFGFPLMLLAVLAPKEPILTLVILFAFFVVMNIILFRKFIFKKRDKSDK